MEVQENRQAEDEVTLSDILNSDQNPSHGVQVMRHYLLRMMKKKNHEVNFSSQKHRFTCFSTTLFPSHSNT